MGAESGTRRGDDVGFFQEEIEEIPALHAIWCLDPGVGGVGCAVYGVAGFGQAVADDMGVFHVVIDISQALFLSFRAVVRFGCALDDVRRTVEEGALTTVPERIQFNSGSIGFIGFAGMGDDDIGAARTGETGAFGIGAQFDSHVFSAFHFKNAVGNVRFGDIRFIGRIVDDDEIVFFGGADPVFQFCLAHGRTGRVGRVAEVDHIDVFCRRLGFEAVFRRAGQIDDAGIAARAGIVKARVAAHDVGIEIYRIYRIGYGEGQIAAEDFLDAGCICFGTVADEDFIQLQIDAPCFIIAVNDGLTEKIVTLFRTIAAEGFGLAHFIDGFMHRFDDGRGQRTGDVANAETDDVRIGMGLGIGGNFFGNGSKEIIAGKF